MQYLEVVVGFLGGVTIVAIALAIFAWRRSLMTGRALRRTGGEAHSSTSSAEALVRDLERRIDSRIRELEALVERSEDAVSRLRAARNEARTSHPSGADRHEAGSGESNRESGLTQPADVRGEILSLFDSGFSAIAISQAVGVPRGEVELILSLEGERPFRRTRPGNQSLK